MAVDPIGIRAIPASQVLGRKLDSIPFSAYHVVIILVLGFVGFIEGYDLALTGSLLVLAKAPLHPARRRPGAANHGRRTGDRRRQSARAVAALLEVVRPGSVALDRDRHSVRHLRRHRLLVLIGACIPFALGRETLGNPETFTEVLPELA